MKKRSEQRFVSERLKPVPGTADTTAMGRGEPGLPREFVWREARLRIARVLATWRETGPCTHGSGELYVRKHWFDVEMADGQIGRIYFERQPRGRNRRARWWLFSIGGVTRSSAAEEGKGDDGRG